MAMDFNSTLTPQAAQALRSAAPAAGSVPGRAQSILARAGAAMSPERIRETAEQFEAVFVTEMLRPMLDQVSAEPPFGGGFGESVWKSMLADEYGKSLVKQGGIGLADAVAQELLHAQEAMQEATQPTTGAAFAPAAAETSKAGTVR